MCVCVPCPDLFLCPSEVKVLVSLATLFLVVNYKNLTSAVFKEVWKGKYTVMIEFISFL